MHGLVMGKEVETTIGVMPKDVDPAKLINQLGLEAWPVSNVGEGASLG